MKNKRNFVWMMVGLVLFTFLSGQIIYNNNDDAVDAKEEVTTLSQLMDNTGLDEAACQHIIYVCTACELPESDIAELIPGDIENSYVTKYEYNDEEYEIQVDMLDDGSVLNVGYEDVSFWWDGETIDSVGTIPEYFANNQ